jgi:UDP-N-acetylglucosamine/UDP-N-acetylgalactosamine diphosphorylase
MDTEELKKAFEAAGQGQVFRFFDELDADQQQQLIDDAIQVDLAEMARLVDTLVNSEGEGNEALADELSPASYLPLPSKGGDAALWNKAHDLGEQALRDGRVAAFTVAGGQGTRLGYDGPKGTFPVTPILKKPLFQVFAEKIRAANERYGRSVPWFLMTSEINHDATVEFFEANDYFGLGADQVFCFSQGLMPAVDPNGKILLTEKHRMALSPDGHGGSLRALVRSGATTKMRERGVDVLSYFQVDNPLVHCIDPAFVGHHLLNGSELSSKTVLKIEAEEKVGVFCEKDGTALVIEYSDLPQRLATERDDPPEGENKGPLRFRAGSVAIHLFDRDFVERLGSGADAAASLPFHKASKKVPTLDSSGNPVNPDAPNAVKFEMFVFDALPFSKNPVIIEAAREDEFSAVKNADGVDSAETCRNDQMRQFARWLIAAGAAPGVDDSGLPCQPIEISPLIADSKVAFDAYWRSLDEKPALDQPLVLDRSSD